MWSFRIDFLLVHIWFLQSLQTMLPRLRKFRKRLHLTMAFLLRELWCAFFLKPRHYAFIVFGKNVKPEQSEQEDIHPPAFLGYLVRDVLRRNVPVLKLVLYHSLQEAEDRQ